MPIYDVWTAAGGRLGSIIAKNEEHAIKRAQEKYYHVAQYVDLHLFNDKFGYTWNPSGEKGLMPHNPIVAERVDKRPWGDEELRWYHEFMRALGNGLQVTVTPCGGDDIYVTIVLRDPKTNYLQYTLCDFTYKEGEEVDMQEKIAKTLLHYCD